MPHQHPDPLFFLVSAFAAVLVAPFAEEYLFRGLLQGWLENIAAGLPAVHGAPVNGTDDGEPAVAGASEPSSHFAPRHDAEKEIELGDARSPGIRGPAWPILVSALVFALMHWSHGPDPIPLFFFAVGLGFLYRQTHRLMPCIVVHLLLNGLTLLSMYVSVVYGNA